MIIIEGLEGVGKTTLVNYFVSQGMKKHHFDYDVNNMDLFSKYMGCRFIDFINEVICFL